MKKVLMIGATSGIAQAIAAELAGKSAELYLLGRSPEKLQLVAEDLRTRFQCRVETEAFDFDDFNCHAAAIERAEQALNGLDAAFICHGTLGDQKAGQLDFALAEQEFRNNCLSAMSFASHLANRFEERKAGTIVGISSVAGDRGRQSNYIYGAAKAGFTAFLAGLRNRLYRSGVHVLTVKPGFVDTPMTAGLPRSPLMVPPAVVARDIVRAAERGRSVLYTPWFWRWIMLIIRSIPETIFRRLSL